MGDEDEAFTASDAEGEDYRSEVDENNGSPLAGGSLESRSPIPGGEEEEEGSLGDLDEQEAANFLRAAEEGDVDGIQIVKEQPDLLDVQDDLGNSALHLAALGAHIECVRELIEAGADLNALNDEGNTSLILSTICMAEGAGDCAKVMVKAGADAEIQNLQGCRAIHYACGEGNMPVVEYLVKGAKVDVRAVSNDMLTPLLCAMINNRGEVSSLLIRHDLGLLSIADSNGDFPLHFAVLERLTDMVEILLQEGVGPLIATSRGETPLMGADPLIAISRGQTPLMGADPLIATSRGETPLMVAVDVQAEEEIVGMLKAAEEEAHAQAA
ncbi:ankyrin repeat-containing domain protein, partial [Baffinella frigidus]